MVKVLEAIVVEGRYDKNTLSQVVDAHIFETSGFQIMKDPLQLQLLRRVAKERGLIVFTDSDGAGFVIRNYLKGAIDPACLKHAYIPNVPGKEKRKRTPGKEGILGVEGMRPDVILECLRRAGATMDGNCAEPNQEITKQDLVELGLSGGKNSAQNRGKLMEKLQLPKHLSANGLLQALNLLYTKTELMEAVSALEKES